MYDATEINHEILPFTHCMYISRVTLKQNLLAKCLGREGETETNQGRGDEICPSVGSDTSGAVRTALRVKDRRIEKDIE